MLDPEFSIRDDFPPADREQWLAVAQSKAGLKRRTHEGLDLQTVYSREDRLGEGDVSGLPGWPPFVRGTRAMGSALSGWDLRQQHASPQPSVANEAILADLEGGVSSLLLVLDRAASAGFDPDDERAKACVGSGGLMAYHVDDLDRVLADVELSMIGVSLEAGAASLPASALLVALWRRRQDSPDDVRGAFNADPIAVLAREGRLPVSLETALAQMSSLAEWTAKNYSQVKAVGVDTSPYHHAGATDVQDLALAMATGVQYLRSMTDAGLDIDRAAQQILFRMSLGTQHFHSIAKLRAGRRLWARVVEACGGKSESAEMCVHARISDRVLTRHDPYVNLLRNTVGVFAAGLGGAEAITSLPLDYLTGQDDAFSRRLARNTALILQEESHLHRVIDPAGGSWYLEQLTEQVAEKAWGIFQEIERQGGILPALESGWVAKQLEAANAFRENVATQNEGTADSSEASSDQNQLRESATKRIASLRNENVSLTNLSTTEAIEAAESGVTLGQLAAGLGFHRETTSFTPLKIPRSAAAGASNA